MTQAHSARDAVASLATTRMEVQVRCSAVVEVTSGTHHFEFNKPMSDSKLILSLSVSLLSLNLSVFPLCLFISLSLCSLPAPPSHPLSRVFSVS